MALHPPPQPRPPSHHQLLPFLLLLTLHAPATHSYFASYAPPPMENDLVYKSSNSLKRSKLHSRWNMAAHHDDAENDAVLENFQMDVDDEGDDGFAPSSPSNDVDLDREPSPEDNWEEDEPAANDRDLDEWEMEDEMAEKDREERREEEEQNREEDREDDVDDDEAFRRGFSGTDELGEHSYSFHVASCGDDGEGTVPGGGDEGDSRGRREAEERFEALCI
ncbi:hypothetical protein BDY24DRAFT_419494 [Mrakia frigida]|uniref:uncharacterized protein n=1 Tax=Mrakia frigida TaxID=29902 RepID=UPI003FCC2615